MRGQTERDKDSSRRERIYKGAGIPWSFIAAGLILAAMIILIAQNTEDAEVTWIAWDARAPLVVVILVAMVLGAALYAVSGLIWRHRRRRRLTEREELRRRRAEEGVAAASAATVGSPSADTPDLAAAQESLPDLEEIDLETLPLTTQEDDEARADR